MFTNKELKLIKRALETEVKNLLSYPGRLPAGYGGMFESTIKELYQIQEKVNILIKPEWS